MDSLEIPADIIDEQEIDLPDFNLGKEVAKSLTLSAAETAGVAGGFVVAALAFAAVKQIHSRFFNKKPAEPEIPDITTLPKEN